MNNRKHVYFVCLIKEHTFDNCSLNSSNFCCNGVFSSSASAISDRILPTQEKKDQQVKPIEFIFIF